MTLVPHEELHPDTLARLIEEFVTRDGAVHGHNEVSTERRISAVMGQLKSGLVVIAFDEETESCTVIAADQIPKKNGPA
jgi:uncharacterized protein